MWRCSTVAASSSSGCQAGRPIVGFRAAAAAINNATSIRTMHTLSNTPVHPAHASFITLPLPSPLVQSLRALSSKARGRRSDLHPHQKRTHEAAGRAVAEALKRGLSVKEAFKLADKAAKEEGEMEPQAPGGDQAAENPDQTLTLPSTLVSTEQQSSKRPPPQPPSSFDAAGRAILRTRMHPQGALVGRGRVVANFGTSCLVMELPWDAEQEKKMEEAAKNHSSSDAMEPLRFTAIPRGKLGKILCGDEVLWEWAANSGGDNQGYIVEVLPRKTEFRRMGRGSSSSSGKPGSGGNGNQEEQILAANFSHICIICAAAPPTNAALIDRYIAMAQSWGVGVCIVFNKMDLPQAGEFEEILQDFERVGIEVFRTSCAPGKEQGIEELRRHLAKVGPDGKPGISIFVGQSGSGKSSLLNTLSPSLQLKVNELSRFSQGRHTTTQTILHTLESGGEIIDSPGFQNFQPVLQTDAKAIAAGFREMIEPAKFCHFGPRCLHLTEPLCAVRLCLRHTQAPSGMKQFIPAPLPEPETSLSTKPVDAPHTPEAQKASQGDVPEALSPEAHFFSEFQKERARQLEQGISDIDDASIGSGLSLSGDSAETALGESKTKSLDSKARKKKWDAMHRRETVREIEQIVEENEKLRRKAEEMAFAEEGGGRDASSTPNEGGGSVEGGKETDPRLLQLVQLLSQNGLIHSISSRRYQSYVQLVQNQLEKSKKKYEKK